MTRITGRLTAKNRDELQNPMLSNQVWATFYFLIQKKLNLNKRKKQRIKLQQIYWRTERRMKKVDYVRRTSI